MYKEGEMSSIVMQLCVVMLVILSIAVFMIWGGRKMIIKTLPPKEIKPVKSGADRTPVSEKWIAIGIVSLMCILILMFLLMENWMIVFILVMALCVILIILGGMYALKLKREGKIKDYRQIKGAVSLPITIFWLICLFVYFCFYKK